jgi:site-specific DNA recombinase
VPSAMAPRHPAGYARISSDDALDAHGVGRQEADIRAECERRVWPEPEMYVDNDLSASPFAKKRRPEWERLLADLESGVVDGVLVWKLDRATRMGIRGVASLLDALDAHGAVLVSLTESIDTTTAIGQGTLGLLASVARQESEDTSTRLRRKNVDLAQAGAANMGGVRPFGWQKDRVTLDKQEARLLREAVDRVLAGERVGAIANDWNRRGIATVKGNRWDGTTLRRQLTTSRLAGIREHNGVVAADKAWQPVVTRRELNRLRSILGGPKGASGGPPTARTYLLSGFAVCGKCGARMTAHPAAGVRRYFCLTSRGGCNRVGIGAEPTEGIVSEAVMQLLDEAKLPQAVDENDDASAQVAALTDRLHELADTYAEGEISKAEWLRARQGIEDRLAKAKAASLRVVRDRAADRWIGVGAKLRKAWPGMTLDGQRAVIAAVLDRVTIAPTTRAAGRFDPDRIDVTWKV